MVETTSGNQYGQVLEAHNTQLRQHRGDFLSPETRSRVMSRIRGKNTGLELRMAELLQKANLEWESHASDLPGKPDFVFRIEKLALFVDGDFWHGWNFSQWRLKLSEEWEAKIEATRKRDKKNYKSLRKMGWKVIRIWEHQIMKNPDKCLKRILDALTPSHT